MADANEFNDIAERLMLVNEMMLTNLIEGIKSGSIKSETDEKKMLSTPIRLGCYQLYSSKISD